MHHADSVIGTRVIRTTNSGAYAHYLFSELPSGQYLIYTRWGVGVEEVSADMPLTTGGPASVYQWLVPVTVHGNRLRADLNTDREMSARIYCGI